ncbi:S8 family serine peptidase [Archangium violaceum]|uniref:S8 family serine peptidase n=1 Tax=Archangium violaceum TaxID=83451 RepID=UPI002B2DF57B|nr:S8 family serine peptidase [Archangium gephyra]
MHKPAWKNLMLIGSLTLLPACGSPSLDATGNLGQTADLAQKTGTQESARDAASTPGARFRKSADAIPGQYIVVLKATALRSSRVPEVAQALARQRGATVLQTYSHALSGFAVQANEAAARALAASPEVDFVVEDGEVHAMATQSNATWGLDRIDQINLPLNGSYGYNGTGAGVHAYIIDSGIMTSHPDFGGRASEDFTAINDGYRANDCNGHGTHVAGTVGGSTWGVAKGVRLHSVRVLGCNASGPLSGVISGLDWVAANHVKPAVANMSLGGVTNDALDAAVRNTIAAGVTVVVAAGNNSPTIDACYISPARVAEAITVGSVDSTDSRFLGNSQVYQGSNFGPCLDVFAPGVNIVSAALNGTSRPDTGTSMASPHVAGAAALYLQSNPGASPATVAAAIVINSPDNKVTNAGSGSTTRLLYSNPPPSCGTLSSGQALAPGQTLPSCDGRIWLTHQTDGNVVLYDQQGALWSTGTWGTVTSTFIMQTDGNLVLYPSSTSAIWNTVTGNKAGATLWLQQDCNLVVYSADGTPLWASYTTCR